MAPLAAKDVPRWRSRDVWKQALWGRGRNTDSLCPVFALARSLYSGEASVLSPPLAVGGQGSGERDFICLRGVAVILQLLAFGVCTSLNSWSVGI